MEDVTGVEPQTPRRLSIDLPELGLLDRDGVAKLVAVVRKLFTILNATLRDRSPWNLNLAASRTKRDMVATERGCTQNIQSGVTNNMYAIGYLFITGIFFGLVGAFSLVDPVAGLALIGVHVEGVNGLNQMRASAGGVTLAIGGFMIYAAFQPHLHRIALWMVATVLGGLELGRITSFLLDGIPGPLILLYMALEVVGLIQVVFLLRAEHRDAAE